MLGTAPGPGTSSSPKSIVADALTAARTEGSVHFVETASAGKQSLSVVGDVSPTKGRQTITVRYGSSVGHMSGLWAADHVYFRGDSYGLQSFLGMSATLARKYKNRWYAFSNSDPGFDQTAKQFTVQGPLSEISLTGQLSMTGLAVINGVSAQVVRGKTMALSSNGGTGTGTLYVADTGTRLPVRFTGTGHQSAGRPTPGWTSAAGANRWTSKPRPTPSRSPRSSDRVGSAGPSPTGDADVTGRPSRPT